MLKQKREEMRKIKAALTFYVVSFIGIHIVFFLIEPKSYFSIEISKSISGQNGLTGFIAIFFFLTVLGSVISLIGHMCSGGLINVAKEFEHKGFWKSIRAIFLGKPKDRDS